MDRQGYTIEIWNNMTSEWDTSRAFWNRRYAPVHQEFEALIADARDAEMFRAFQIIRTPVREVYDAWSNRD